MALTTKETMYFWKKAKQQAEKDGWEPGTHGYWEAVREHFAESTHDSQLAMDFEAVYRGPRRNPSVTPEPLPERNTCRTPRRNPSEVDDRAYRDFHGVEPRHIDAKKAWVPGDLILLGEGVDVGYRAVDHASTKGPGPYVHDFGRGVKVYRRARPGERPDKVWSRFPADLTVLGKALGFSYRENGEVREVKGGARQLATTPNRRVLVLVGGKGVDYLIEGGNMHVADWIRD